MKASVIPRGSIGSLLCLHLQPFTPGPAATDRMITEGTGSSLLAPGGVKEKAGSGVWSDTSPWQGRLCVGVSDCAQSALQRRSIGFWSRP